MRTLAALTILMTALGVAQAAAAGDIAPGGTLRAAFLQTSQSSKA